MPLKQCQQKVLIDMLNDGHKINFFKQKVYPSFRVFSKEMQILKNADLINMKIVTVDGKELIEYSLSADGIIFTKLLKFVLEKMI
jgi:hypothetical protein